MHFSNLDAYFHMAAHGDQEAYQLLYKEFRSRAEQVIKNSGFNLAKYPGIRGDFDELTDREFLHCMNDYDSEKGTFSHYVEYILGTRVLREAQEIIFKWTTKTVDLDYDEAELVMAERETPQSYSEKMTNEYAVRDFRLRISSSTRHISNEERLERRLLILLYAGCKASEIREKLKISEGKYRILLEKVKESEDITKLKLELK